MQKCTVYHTSGSRASGIIKDNKVSIKGEMYIAKEEYEDELAQFSIDGKWGFANMSTGDIIIEPIWDYAGPFYKGYARVMLKKNEKHGFIDSSGEIIIPLDYDDARDCSFNNKFWVAIDKKWGLINDKNKPIISIIWKRLEIGYDDLIFCATTEEASEAYIGVEDRLTAMLFGLEPVATYNTIDKWGVYDKRGKLIIKAKLDEKPKYIEPERNVKRKTPFNKYYLLQENIGYGVLCSDGRLISDTSLYKKDAMNIINGRYNEE